MQWCTHNCHAPQIVLTAAKRHLQPQHWVQSLLMHCGTNGLPVLYAYVHMYVWIYVACVIYYFIQYHLVQSVRVLYALACGMLHVSCDGFLLLFGALIFNFNTTTQRGNGWHMFYSPPPFPPLSAHTHTHSHNGNKCRWRWLPPRQMATRLVARNHKIRNFANSSCARHWLFS